MDTVTQLEQRAERKNKIRLTYQLPVIALTLNIPANLTHQAWVPMLFKSALDSFLDKMEEMEVNVIEQQFATTPIYEALFAVDIHSSTLLKKAAIEI
ncbi:citrate lyase holo-[acyl-carrier protein] synthase, partial [Vibrio aestuarianus]